MATDPISPTDRDSPAPAGDPILTAPEPDPNEKDNSNLNNKSNEPTRSKFNYDLTLEPYEPPSLRALSALTKDEKIAILSASTPIPLFNNKGFLRFYILTFPGINIKTDLNVIEANQQLQAAIGIPKKIVTIDTKSLLIEVNSVHQSMQIMNIKTIANNPVIVKLHPTLNTAKGLVTSTAMTKCSEDQLKEVLRGQGVSNIERLTRKTPQGEIMHTNRYILTFTLPDLPTLIKITSWHYELIQPYASLPMRCYKCQLLGHTSSKCRRDEVTCARCGKDGHSSATCANPVYCVNCGLGHAASSNDCPHYQFRREVLVIQSRECLTYNEAKAQLQAKYASQGKRFSFRLNPERRTGGGGGVVQQRGQPVPTRSYASVVTKEPGEVPPDFAVGVPVDVDPPVPSEHSSNEQPAEDTHSSEAVGGRRLSLADGADVASAEDEPAAVPVGEAASASTSKRVDRRCSLPGISSYVGEELPDILRDDGRTDVDFTKDPGKAKTIKTPKQSSDENDRNPTDESRKYSLSVKPKTTDVDKNSKHHKHASSSYKRSRNPSEEDKKDAKRKHRSSRSSSLNKIEVISNSQNQSNNNTKWKQ
jgi:hypothetical protein